MVTYWENEGSLVAFGGENWNQAIIPPDMEKYPRFYSVDEMAPGDFALARRGRKTLAAVGKITAPAMRDPGRNPAIGHPGFLKVMWAANRALDSRH